MFLALALPAMVACGCENNETPRAPLTAFVAASTKEAVEEIGRAFEKETGISLKVSPGGSNTLAGQIIEGAPADVFLSANEEWADSVKAKGQAVETRKLLGNKLAIVVPKGNPGGVTSPEGLRAESVKHVALAGEKVPAGKYAEQSLRALGIYDGLVADKKVVRGQDVRVTLAYVERGEAEAGIVYATDARVSKDVETAYPFDSKTHDPIVYPLVLLKASQKNEGARKLYTYLGSPEARAVFERHGFTFLE